MVISSKTVFNVVEKRRKTTRYTVGAYLHRSVRNFFFAVSPDHQTCRRRRLVGQTKRVYSLDLTIY